MKQLLLCLLFVAAAWAQAQPSPAGRWEGSAMIPGAALPMVVDLEAGATGVWQGSVILPGRGVKGAVLADLRVHDKGVSFSLSSAIADSPPTPGATVDLQWMPDGRLAGAFRQGGHAAVLSLSRSGPAQVDLPPPPPALAPGLRGVWRGRYELGGYAREVTLTLAAVSGAADRGEMVIVGRRRSVVAMDRIDPGRGFVVLESSASGVRIEGRWSAADGRIDGHFILGPFEASLVLTKEPSAP